MASSTGHEFNKELGTSVKFPMLSWFRWTVGATGAVGTVKQGKSGFVTSVTRNSAGNYTVQLSRPYPVNLLDIKIGTHTPGVTDAFRKVNYDASTYNPATGQFVLFTSGATTDATFASGTITCVAKASFDDNDTVTIGDGLSAPKIYEFDFAGDGVTGGSVQVNISSDTTATQVAARLLTAINTNQPSLTVSNGSGVLTLTSKIPGTAPNVTITETVTNSGFLVTGMSGGAATAAPAALDPIQDSEIHISWVNQWEKGTMD